MFGWITGLLKMKLILILAFLIGIIGNIHAKTDKTAAANEFVFRLLDILNSIDVKPDELYFSHVPRQYKSSFIKDVEPSSLNESTFQFDRYTVGYLKKLSKGEILQSNILGSYACVFVYHDGVIGAFSLVNENGWRLAEFQLGFIKHEMPFFCSFFYDELGIKNDAFLVLDERLIPGSSDSKN